MESVGAKRTPLLLLAGAACLALAMAVPLRTQFAAGRPTVDDRVEMALFPSGQFLRAASLGHRHLVADLCWLAGLQYYGKHRRTDRRYPLVRALFNVVTDADPGFEGAYLFAALVLVEAGELPAAVKLLQRGTERNPRSWRLRFELGFMHYVFTGSWDEAAAAFAAAARLPGAAEYTRRFAATAYEKAGDPETARQLWATIARESENPEVRRMAVERLQGDS